MVLDEAYFEYSGQKRNSVELVSNFPNLLITRSFSKAYGLAALRIGYAIGSEKVIAYMNRVRQPFNVNSIAQKAASIALDDNNFVKEFIKKFKKSFSFIRTVTVGLGFTPSLLTP